MSYRTVGLPLAVVSAAAASLAALAGFAQQGPGGPPGGFPGGPQGPPGANQQGPAVFIVPALLEAADADEDGSVSAREAAEAVSRFIKENAPEGKTSLDEQELARALNRRFGPPPGFGPGGDDFGPGMFLAAPILEAADVDKDSRLSVEEATRAASKFIADTKGAKAGALTGEELAQAIGDRMGPPPGFGGPGGPGGFGGPGGPGGQDRKLLKAHDKDGDGRLNAAERAEAMEAVAKEAQAGGGRRGPGGFGPRGFGMGGGEGAEPAPGAKVAVADAANYPGKPLYDPTIIRTLFLDFENGSWEKELSAFYKSDVEVPATLTVDGKTYPGVGVHFRGMSSYFTVPEGRKRSLNVSLDHTDPELRVDGAKTLNLLNAHEDPSFLHTVLYSEAARRYIPAPRANFVRVVINGESWGLYVNAQQFDKSFLEDQFGTDNGARWKVPGSPAGDGGLRYLGDDPAEYKARFEIKSKDRPADWDALIRLCKTLDETPAAELAAEIEPMLDVEGTLWFLALENALCNGDGYWVRASDYSLYRDKDGKFHVVPHDMNETFQPAMMMGGPGGGGRGGRGGRGGGPGGPGGGPGGFGGPGRPGGPSGFAGPGGPGGPPVGPGGAGQPNMQGPGGGRPLAADLDSLIGLDDERKPLRSKLLAVPAYRESYLRKVKAIADDWLDWEKLGPVVARYRDLIEDEVAADTRKLTPLDAFQAATANSPAPAAAPAQGRRPSMSLRAFAEARRKYLLDYPEIKKLDAE